MYVEKIKGIRRGTAKLENFVALSTRGFIKHLQVECPFLYILCTFALILHRTDS